MLFRSAGSSIGIGKALLNTLMGMGTVFLVLIFISFVISLLKNVNKIGQEQPKQIEQAPAPVSAPVQIEEIEEEELVDDEELVAVITAAICEYQGASLEGFQVRSIKRVQRKR